MAYLEGMTRFGDVLRGAADMFASEAVARGVTLRLVLAEDSVLLREGLVRLFDVVVESPYSYWFVCRPRALQQRPVKMFRDWLIEESTRDGNASGIVPAA